MSIERLPGTPSTPTFLLHKLLEDADKIESLVVVVGWKQGDSDVTHQVCWTSQPNSRLAFASITCQQVVAKTVVDI